MSVHRRTQAVTVAELEVGDAVAAAIRTHDLTYIELIGILNRIQANWLKYALRHERHPEDPTLPADEE